MTLVLRESWILTVPIVSRVYLATHLSRRTLTTALKLLTAGRITPFVDGLILLGTVVSVILAVHFHFVHLLRDQWGIAVALTACGILVCTVWITKIAEHRAAPHEVNAFEDEPLDLGDPEVEIAIRLAPRGPAILGKRLCIVTIHIPVETARIAEHGIRNLPGGDEKCNERQHHKLPFWLKR